MAFILKKIIELLKAKPYDREVCEIVNNKTVEILLKIRMPYLDTLSLSNISRS